MDDTYRLLCDLFANRAEHCDWIGLKGSACDAMVRTAEAEGVAPLAYWHLNQLGWTASLPEAVRTALAGLYWDSAAHNALLLHELARILRNLRNAGVPVVVLKGVVLATSVYPDPALRPLGDLDLLVHREDATRAAELVRSCGYDAIEFFRGFSLEFGHHLHLVSRGRPNLAVEVHWNLVAHEADRLAPPEDWSWAHAREWSSAPQLGCPGESCRALTLTDEAHFLYLVAHLVLQHPASQDRLIWWYDLELLLHACAETADWHSAVLAAREIGWLGGLVTATSGLQQRFGSSLPGGLSSALAAAREGVDSENPLRPVSASPSRKRGVLGVFRALDWGARMRLLRGLALPSRAFMEWYYEPRSKWLWPAYYPRRWLEVVQDAAQALLHE